MEPSRQQDCAQPSAPAEDTFCPYKVAGSVSASNNCLNSTLSILNRSGVGEAPARPGDREGMVSGRGARSRGHGQGAGPRTVGDRIRVESRVHARREPPKLKLTRS